LESLSNKDRGELIESYSSINIEAICLLSKELLQNELNPDEVTENKYLEIVPKLRKAMIYWSRELGEAIIAADDECKEGNIQRTIKILEAFSNKCPASFYNSIAQAQSKKYRERLSK
jgi:hypothetical protein